MMATSSASAALADSLASLSKSAYHAFAEIEEKSSLEVARAVADALEARKERDKAVDALHSAQLECQRWKGDLITCKASLQQAESTIAHQAEMIATLRREANQWKDQSKNWQDHFLRVEQERCALYTRIDETITERLKAMVYASDPNTPYTSHYGHHNQRAPSIGNDIAESSRSATKSSKQPKTRPSSSASKAAHAHNTPGNRADKIDTRTPKSLTPKLPTESSTTMRPAVIRRVQAVINVKREESDEEEVDHAVREDDPNEVVLLGKHPRRGGRKRKIVVPEDGQSIYSEASGDRAPGKGSEESSESRENDDQSYSPSDDDELRMGAETNHDELYAKQRVKFKRTTQGSSEANKKPRLSAPSDSAHKRKKV